MNMFESEQEMLSIIEKHNRIINECISGNITFQEFLDKYNNFYAYYALDGHESDLEEQKLLEKYENKIALHREVFEMLSGLCSDEDANKDSYIRANRFGSKEGLRRLKVISEKYSIL